MKTVEEALKRFPPAKLQRLVEIRERYPGIPLEEIPEALKRELQDILHSLYELSRQEKRTGQPPPPPAEQPSLDYAGVYSLLGRDIQTHAEVRISQLARRQTLWLIGASGTGKSTLLSSLILSDIRQGLGVALIEPHGDLTAAVLGGIPEHRLKDVVYLDMTDTDHPFGLNLFECNEQTIYSMALTSNFVYHTFQKIWGAGTDTPRLMQVLRAVTLTLIENQGASFSEIPLLFSSDTVRDKMVANLTNQEIINFWEEYERKAPYRRDDLVDSTKNKIQGFLAEPIVRNIVAQSKTTIDFRGDIMDSGKILLVKLSPQFEEASMFIGAILIGKILMAAISRADIPESNRRQFNLFTDEFQRFSTTDFATLIAEARKFAIGTTLANQTLSQLDNANQAAVQAAGNMIVFRVSGEDAKALARSFDHTPTREAVGEEAERAPVGDVIGHLIRRGHSNPRVTRFAQVYLQNLETYLGKRECLYVTDMGFLTLPISVRDIYFRKGREALNGCLYRAMVEKNANTFIPPLALLILAISQEDQSADLFLPYFDTKWLLDEFEFIRLEGRANVFGEASFINEDSVTRFINSTKRKQKKPAQALVSMIVEMRYTITILAQDPILTDTGRYHIKYQQRTYSDMENEIGNFLSCQKNYQARVKLINGDRVIQTLPQPPGLSGEALEERIGRVKRRMITLGYTRHYKEVEQEVRLRQERLKRQPTDTPPPTHTAGIDRSTSHPERSIRRSDLPPPRSIKAQQRAKGERQ